MWLPCSSKLILLLLACSVTVANSSNGRVKKAVQVLIDEEPSKSCSDCSSNSAGKSSIDEEDVIHELRLEYIKKQILNKLNLDHIPNVVRPEKKLPVPLTVKRQITHPPMRDIPEPNYYGLTNQLILISQPYNAGLCSSAKNPSACFHFQLPAHVPPEDVSWAELWVFKLADFMDGDAVQRLIYYEIQENHIVPMRDHATRTDEGWIKQNITKEVREWLHTEKYSPVMEVECLSCGYSRPWSPVSQEDGFQPLLVVNVEDKNKKKRLRRNINCRPGMSECCREKIYVSFKELSWGQWILEPDGFEAYYCNGSCTNVASVPLRTLHSSTVGAAMYNSKRVELVPCCSPTSHTDLQVIFMPDNKTVTRTTLPNMIVQSCGCM